MNRLEQRVEILEQLPDRVTAVESQIVQLRDEMRSGFSALHEEIRAGDDETRRVLTEQMDSRFDVLSKQMVSLSDGLSERMMSLFDKNELHMRLLHEDLVERIARMGEGRNR